jgi:hypothetical protein
MCPAARTCVLLHGATHVVFCVWCWPRTPSLGQPGEALGCVSGASLVTAPSCQWLWVCGCSIPPGSTPHLCFPPAFRLLHFPGVIHYAVASPPCTLASCVGGIEPQLLGPVWLARLYVVPTVQGLQPWLPPPLGCSSCRCKASVLSSLRCRSTCVRCRASAWLPVQAGSRSVQLLAVRVGCCSSVCAAHSPVFGGCLSNLCMFLPLACVSALASRVL